MFKVVVRQAVPFQVEFPEKVLVEGKPIQLKRSKVGSLHCMPNAVLFLTKDEYDFLIEKYKYNFVFFGEEEKKQPKRKIVVTKEVQDKEQEVSFGTDLAISQTKNKKKKS